MCRTTNFTLCSISICERAIRMRTSSVWLVLGLLWSAVIVGAGNAPRPQERDAIVSYSKDITPIFGKYCLPCHAEESDNSSGLSLDTYALLMKGGEHGTPVVPGDTRESLLLRKLEENPPFGDQMPLKSRRSKSSRAVKRLTSEELQLIQKWIEQGAKEN